MLIFEKEGEDRYNIIDISNPYKLMKTSLVSLLVLAVVTNCLYTSSHWTKQGIDVADGVFE